MCLPTSRPSVCQRIKVSTANRCRRSCARGWTVAVRIPMAVVIFRRVFSTVLRCIGVPAVLMKNDAVRGCGHSRSRSAA